MRAGVTLMAQVILPHMDKLAVTGYWREHYKGQWYICTRTGPVESRYLLNEAEILAYKFNLLLDEARAEGVYPSPGAEKGV